MPSFAIEIRKFFLRGIYGLYCSLSCALVANLCVESPDFNIGNGSGPPMNTNLSVQDLRKIATGMQNNRLLTLSFPEDDAPHEILLVNRLEGEESLSRDFRFVIEILSDNAKLDPKDFVGKLISVQLLRDDGSFRYFNGYIFAFRLIKTARRERPDTGRASPDDPKVQRAPCERRHARDPRAGRLSRPGQRCTGQSGAAFPRRYVGYRRHRGGSRRTSARV